MSVQSGKNSISSIKLYADKNWLSEQYKSKSIYQISSECGVAPSTIRKYMKRFGLQARSISESMTKKYQDEQYLQKRQEQWCSNEYRSKHQQIAEDNKDLKSQISNELWSNDEYADKVRTAHTNAMQGDETRKQISTAIKKKWQDKEYITKQSALSEEKSKRFSEIMLKLWQDDEYREQKTTSNIMQGEVRRLSSAEFVGRAELVHSDHFDYSNVVYVTYDRHRVDIICNNCSNQFQQIPGNHLAGSLCPYCRISTAHRAIHDYLKSLRSDVDIILNDRSVIGPLELDIFIPKYNLAIEYHGLRWHSFDRFETSEEKTRHQRKALLCVKKGIKLLQVFDFQWTEKNDIIKSMLGYHFGVTEKLDARKCSIQPISVRLANEFFESWHLHGSRSAKYNYGLFYKNELIMAAGFSRFGDCLEIMRLASIGNTVIRGGVSRLIRFAKNNIDCCKVKTFVDLCMGNGLGYYNSGFKLEAITKPGYFYYKNDLRLSRQQCQKHKLQKLLGDGFDPEQSESVNMFRNGFRRVWNAGNLRLATTN